MKHRWSGFLDDQCVTEIGFWQRAPWLKLNLTEADDTSWLRGKDEKVGICFFKKV